MSDYTKKIGTLPPSLQGIALDINVGEEVSITTEQHHSEKHGDHFDVYVMKRISESEVDMWKTHIDIYEHRSPLTQREKDLTDKAIIRPFSKEDTDHFRSGGC